MPKYGIHHIVMKNTLRKLAQDNSATAQARHGRSVAAAMAAEPFAASLGAIGPDLIFWAPDYDIVKDLQGLITVKAELDEKIAIVDAIAETIEKCVDKTVADAVAAVSVIPGIGPVVAGVHAWDQLLEKIGEQYEILAKAIEEDLGLALFAKMFGLDGSGTNNGLGRSLFQTLFESKLQEGMEEVDWYWFEMLHYRRTGDYAKKLIDIAEAPAGTDMMKAYAYGYATHYATDFVGHPYVNTISGAPYRISVQRHVVIENYMDQWKWVNEFGESIRNTLVSESAQTRFDLPDQIAEMIADAMKDTYKDDVHPMRYSKNGAGGRPSLGQLFNADKELDSTKACFLTAEDIKLAYKAQRLMLGHLGGREEVIKPEEPFPGADQMLSTILSDADNFAPPAVNPNRPQDDDGLNWDSLLQSMQDALEFALNSIQTIASLLKDIITDPGSAARIADEESRKTVQLVNYWIQLEMYKVYRLLNHVLALSGLSYPEPDEADLSNPVARRLITLEAAEKDKSSDYPLMRNPGQPHLDRRAYVDCNSSACAGVFVDVSEIDIYAHPLDPNPPPPKIGIADQTFLKNHRAEGPVTTPSFYPRSVNTTPDVFISGTPFDLGALTAYAGCSTPGAVDVLYRQSTQVGNAVDLSVFIIQNAIATDVSPRDVTFCNWNLDGDRGYGYKCWDGVPPTVYKSEIENAAGSNSEGLSELRAQGFRCWTSVSHDLVSSFRSSYFPPVYVDKKSFKQLFAAPLTIAQDAIPAEFFDIASFPEPKIWSNLVPEHLKIVPGGRQKNVYFVNGMATSRSSGMRSTKGLQHVINTALFESNIPQYDKTANVIHIRNLMSYTNHPTYNLSNIVDVFESVVDGLLYSLRLDAAIDNGDPIPVFKDPAIVQILALLHHGKQEREKLTLCSHSQGAILVGIAVVLFSKISARHDAYLRSKVKVMHIEPELSIGFRKKVRASVEQYLVYIMNDSDPNKTDMLTEHSAGRVPVFPNQTELNLNDPDLVNLKNLFTRPRLLDVTYYTELQGALTSTGNGVGAYLNVWKDVYENGDNIGSHNMPSQLPVIDADIRGARFRTDPGVLPVSGSGTLVSGRTAALSGPRLDPTSIDVRDFFMT